MFINKTSAGRNNICGQQVMHYREERHLSQRALADDLQLRGLIIDKNAIQRIECGKRFVTDIELREMAAYFGVTTDTLINSADEIASKP